MEFGRIKNKVWIPELYAKAGFLTTTINNLLRDLIDSSSIPSFINNILVATDIEKEYNRIVEEILKEIKENKLHN